MGIVIPPCKDMNETMVIDSMKRVNCESMPLKKVGDYYEGDDGNTTLLVELNDVKGLDLLDSVAGVAIAMGLLGRTSLTKN